MAGNFWHSSHYSQWLLNRQDLYRERKGDLELLGEEDYQKVTIFFANLIQALGEQLKVRQQVIATATVFFKRFYARNALQSIDPLLMAPTAVFLASKVEEFGVISNSRLISTCQSVIKNKYSMPFKNSEFPYRIQNVLECEFHLLETMDCCLILYHPYRPLLQYVADATTEDKNEDNNKILSMAWKVINDSLRTDVPLLYPPYQIALAALHVALVFQGKESRWCQWFSELNVDMEKILEITKQIMSLYELLKTYDEKTDMPTILERVPKPKTAPSRPPSQGPEAERDSKNGGH